MQRRRRKIVFFFIGFEVTFREDFYRARKLSINDLFIPLQYTKLYFI